MPYVICTVSSRVNNEEIQPVGVQPTHEETWKFIKWYLSTFSGKRAKEVLTKVIIRIYAFPDTGQPSTDYDLQTLTTGELLLALAADRNPVRQRGETEPDSL